MPIGMEPAVARRPKPAPQPERHDGLCLEQTREYGMMYCWCTKPCCFHKEGFIKAKRQRSTATEQEKAEMGRPKGRCICKHCPCHDPIYLLPSMATLTRAPGHMAR